MARVAKIHKIERKKGSKRFGISFPRSGRTPYRVFFATEKERDLELKKSVKVAASEGSAVFSITAGDVQLLRDLKAILPDGVDPREAARFYMDSVGSVTTCSLDKARREYELGLQLRRLDQSYRDHVEKTLGRLVASLGAATVVSAVTCADLIKFFSALPFAPVTLANEHQRVSTFFIWARGRGYCSRSPMDSIGRIKVPESEPEFMPVEDAERFFAACLRVQPAAAPFLALSFFAGLRTSSVQRIRRADLRFDEGGILLPGASHKSGRRFYVEGFEPNLWRWLEPWKDEKSLPKLGQSTMIKWRKMAYEAAEVDYPHNGGRHSFCSYHIALKGNASQTASLLTHRGSVSMLYNHYRGNATKTDAVRFFAITPD